MLGAIQCLLAGCLALLSCFGVHAPQASLKSNQELTRLFHEHERQFGLIVTGVNFFSVADPNLNPVELLYERDQEDLLTAHQLGVRDITKKGFFSRVALEMDRSPTAIKEIVWKPHAFTSSRVRQYDKKYDVVSLGENWGIITTPLVQ